MSVVFKFLSIFVFLLLSASVFGVKAKPLEDIFDYTKRTRKMLDVIKEVKASEYLDKIDRFRESFENFMARKKMVCNGSFATVVMSEKGESVKKANKKLSRAEQRLCFREMKALQITYINSMFKVRKSFLDKQHEERVQALREAKDSEIKSLQRRFSKMKRKKR